MIALDSAVFSVARAARYLRVNPGTLRCWIDDGARSGKAYKPVIRLGSTGSSTITWAESVEAALLSRYRRSHGVPMRKLREFVALLRDQFDVPYPLADRRPYDAGRALVIEAQDRVGLDPDLTLVAAVSGQLVLTAATGEFVRRVDWHGNAPVRWHLFADADSPVVIDPERRGGRPSVKGISTQAIWELAESGDDAAAAIAELYGIPEKSVRWGLAHEHAQRAACR